MRKRRKTDMLILHNSKSPWGTSDIIHSWHTDPPPKGNGWEDVGYHFIIEGVYPTYGDYTHRRIRKIQDGRVVAGRPLGLVGSHCKGLNWRSIGVCMIGSSSTLTHTQKATALLLFLILREVLGNNPYILGHYETRSGRAQRKTCPDINMPTFRDDLLVLENYKTLFRTKIAFCKDAINDWNTLQDRIVRVLNG